MLLWIALVIPPLLLGFWAQHRVTATFRRYAAEPSTNRMSGAQVARLILDRNGLSDVPVVAVPGELSDHYDPRKRTVNLSASVYAADSVSAVAVAAHEVGHALQHAKRYAPMQVRSALVPIASLGSNMFMVLFMIGIVLMMLEPAIGILAIQIAIALYAFAVLFAFVTLPVEFNASSRARVQLAAVGAITPAEGPVVGKVLNAAALTYVAGALMAAAQLIYFVTAFLGDE